MNQFGEAVLRSRGPFPCLRPTKKLQHNIRGKRLHCPLRSIGDLSTSSIRPIGYIDHMSLSRYNPANMAVVAVDSNRIFL